MTWQPGAACTSLVIRVLDLQGQLAHHALLPVLGDAATTCLAQAQYPKV